MADTQPFAVSSTPTDIIAGLSLANNTYTVQNVSGRIIKMAERSMPVSDPTTITFGHSIYPPPDGAIFEITVTGSNAVYLWTRGSGSVAVTEAV